MSETTEKSLCEQLGCKHPPARPRPPVPPAEDEPVLREFEPLGLIPYLDFLDFLERRDPSLGFEFSDEAWPWFNIPSFLAGGLIAIFVGGVVVAILAAGA